MTCPQAIDELKAIERCARSRGTPACDAIAARLAAVLEDPALLSALEDARRWRHARKLLTVDDIEGAQGSFDSFGGLVSEEECARTDAAIDAAIAEGNQA